MFDKPIRNTLYGLCDIRNLFAHQLNISFESKTDKMLDAFKKIELHKDRTHYPNIMDDKPPQHPLEPTNTPRDVFIVNLKLCLLELMADRDKHGMWNNIPRGWGPTLKQG